MGVARAQQAAFHTRWRAVGRQARPRTRVGRVGEQPRRERGRVRGEQERGRLKGAVVRYPLLRARAACGGARVTGAGAGVDTLRVRNRVAGGPQALAPSGACRLSQGGPACAAPRAQAVGQQAVRKAQRLRLDARQLGGLAGGGGDVGGGGGCGGRVEMRIQRGFWDF